MPGSREPNVNGTLKLWSRLPEMGEPIPVTIQRFPDASDPNNTIKPISAPARWSLPTQPKLSADEADEIVNKRQARYKHHNNSSTSIIFGLKNTKYCLSCRRPAPFPPLPPANPLLEPAAFLV